MLPVTLDDIKAARANLIEGVRRTPVVPFSTLARIAGASHVWLKCENLQKAGSFKVRGASNRIAALSTDERQCGVVTASAGNHAQGVAVAASAYNVRATVVMPASTPLAKVEATRGYGADVVLHGDAYPEALLESQRLASEHGLIEVHAFDDPRVVAGQGTVGLEIAEDSPDTDVVVVPVGGGGLISGIAVALKTLMPAVRIIGVQAEAASVVQRSFEQRTIVSAMPGPTIADGVRSGGPGDVTLPLLLKYVDDIVLVSEDQIAEAMVLLLERAKLVVEGAGALGVAALMHGRIDVGDKRVGLVLSGGNVDLQRLARITEHGLMQAGRYMNITVGVDDRPGTLAPLSTLLASLGANILSVDHHRFGIGLQVGRVEVAFLLEVRNQQHAREVEDALLAHRHARGRPGEPTFVPKDWLED
jgi:threonine dehydratase